MSVDTVSMTGWGRTAPTTALRFRPRTYEEAAVAVRGRGPRGVVARGLGRAHGDAAQNAGGSVVDMTALDRIRWVDAVTGTVVCDAGVSLHHLMEVVLPLGWFLPVTPATRHVTVGGAIGSDVHGRNHLTAGSFARHVRALELLTAEGEVRTVLPGTDLFDATAGGLGLTGVILSATLVLRPVATSLMSVATERAAGLDEAMARLTATADGAPYAAARIDLLARGRATGRAVLTRGEHAPLDALPAHARRMPLAFRPLQLPAAPAFLPEGLLGRTSATLLNELRHRTAPAARTGELRKISAFFHSMDALPHWNRVYGRGGFVQYQFTVGDRHGETLYRIVRRLSVRRCPAVHAVLKRFGEGGTGWLSFPAPGWTLSFGLPAGLPGLARLLDGLDEEVAAADGRVCLAKDARLRPDVLAAMYPRLPAFQALRQELDPGGAFRSDLSRRLAL
ncbi:FAD-binding oxidoreductase [Streptomyces clavifer]|uniref:FAD-binding oxidoreductase n=1 Tax=Streptomyces TaxID=1883 RepID=UPI0006F62578|nr:MULTISPECIES: FAD-binding oxidoreductase [unclassified Streptomyces]KQX81462.1 decaprenylphosphoryl-beta-D-ribose oxidase [Streptomyces sp. Root1319]KQZ04185.1 decaprenylphosphoryl-beta-D-ribose oxidase [Streptomyces sp. Root55]